MASSSATADPKACPKEPSQVAALAARLRGIRTEAQLHVDSAPKILNILVELDAATINGRVLKESKIGVEVNCLFLRTHDDQRVREGCAALVKRWKGVLAAVSGGSHAQPASSAEPSHLRSDVTGSASRPKGRAEVCQRSSASTVHDVRSKALPIATAQCASNPSAASRGLSLEQRKAALTEGSFQARQAAVLTEVKYLLRRGGGKASMAELNLHVQRIWEGPGTPVQRPVIHTSLRGNDCWKLPAPSLDEAPVVGPGFLDRHADELTYTDMKTKVGVKWNITGCVVSLAPGGDKRKQTSQAAVPQRQPVIIKKRFGLKNLQKPLRGVKVNVTNQWNLKNQ